MAANAARRQVQLMADTMLNRSTTLTIFDESLASADWVRFRGELTRLAASAGPDFVAALHTHAALITPMDDYDPLMIDDDTAAGVPMPTIPQIRQHSLLCVLRQGLPPAGESMRLIDKCVHAGGKVNDAAGITLDQAMVILDRRWGSSPVPKDAGITARKLHSMSWPTVVSVDAYLGFYNSVVSSAATIGMSPIDETAQSQQLRGTWWYVFARPPVSSPYYSVAVEARTVTRQEELTLAHRELFRDAMIRAISNQVAAGATSAKHTGRVVGARYGGLLPGEVLPPDSQAEGSATRSVTAAVAVKDDQRPQPSPFGLVSVPSVSDIAATVEEYGALVGSIVFVATFARPDAAFSAHFLSRFLVRPGPVHLQLARRVLGYLSRTRALCITYRKGVGDPQFSFSPLDDGLAPDKTGRPHLMVDTDHGIVARSVTGWLFMYAGAATAWAVRGQTQPSLSSAESELYGLSTGLCAMLVCVQTLEEMRVVFTAPVPMLTVDTDSRGARLLASDCAVAARTRHIHRRWYFVQHHLEEGHVALKAVKGSLNPSNFLTKAVGGASFAADRAYAMGAVGSTATM